MVIAIGKILGKSIVSCYSSNLGKEGRLHLIPSLQVILDRHPVSKDTTRYSVRIEFCVWRYVWIFNLIRKR